MQVDTRYWPMGAAREAAQVDSAAQPFQLEQGDTVLLLSDGIPDVLSDQQILAVARRHPAPRTAELLVEGALNAGADDNVTAVVIDMPAKRAVADLRPWAIAALVTVLLGAIVGTWASGIMTSKAASRWGAGAAGAVAALAQGGTAQWALAPASPPTAGAVAWASEVPALVPEAGEPASQLPASGPVVVGAYREGPAAVAAGPSSTPYPTRTPAPTRAPKPTAVPAARVLAATGSPAGENAALQPGDQSTPGAGQAASPALLGPPDNDALHGRVTFTWQPAGALPPGAGYEVVWWPKGADPAGATGFAPPTSDTSLSVNIDPLGARTVMWTVLVVNAEPYARLTLPGSSPQRTLVCLGNHQSQIVCDQCPGPPNPVTGSPTKVSCNCRTVD